MLKEMIIKHLGFDPENELDCFTNIKREAHNIRYIKNPSEQEQLAAVKQSFFFYRIYERSLRTSTTRSY